MPTLAAIARDDRSARMTLSMIGVPNDETTGKLLSRVGAVRLVELVGTEDPIPAMDRAEAAVWRDRLRAADTPDRLAARMSETNGFRLIIPSDGDWPDALNDLGARAPYALWARGRAELLTGPLTKGVTMAGARAATGYDVQVTRDFTEDLSREGNTIVAGAAYGIDAEAHRAALMSDGATIAVLASGIDRPYPMAHRDLLDGIGTRGLVISEVPPGVSPTRQRFIDRARLLAALSGGTVIVEAGTRSGSLLTTREAAQLGRPVGAVPGPITSAASVGPNLLLQEGGARAVMMASDVTSMLADKTNAPERGMFRSGASRGVSASGRVL